MFQKTGVNTARTLYVVKDGKPVFHISKGEVRREFGLLISKCHSTVGQDVTKDMEEFFQVFRAMFCWSSRMCPPPLIELLWLGVLVGSTYPTGLATTVLTWLGGLLPKIRACSTGDRGWVLNTTCTTASSFITMEGIQQVAIVDIHDTGRSHDRLRCAPVLSLLALLGGACRQASPEVEFTKKKNP